MSRKTLFGAFALLVVAVAALLLTSNKAQRTDDPRSEPIVDKSASTGGEVVDRPPTPSTSPQDKDTAQTAPAIDSGPGTAADAVDPPGNAEVERFKRTVEEFERDAARFRASYPVYREFEDIVRHTLVPWLIESAKANVDIRITLGLDPRDITSPPELQRLVGEAHKEYGGELWDGMIYSMRGLLLADIASQLSDMAQSGAILVDEKNRNRLAGVAKTFSRQKKQGLESKWPSVEELFPDSSSLYYKVFIATRGDLSLPDFFAEIAGALPADLEERRQQIDQTRHEQGLVEGVFTSPYVDAYHQALLDEFRRVDDLVYVPRDADAYVGEFISAYIDERQRALLDELGCTSDENMDASTDTGRSEDE